ncbi:MAG: beta-galactosidase [Acidobacteriales bacterium]|nr:beta-galactosidase [Terriglobales bacterium]
MSSLTARILHLGFTLLLICAPALAQHYVSAHSRSPAATKSSGLPLSAGHEVAKPVSYELLQDYNKGESLKTVASDFALMKSLGIDTWRGSFGWDDYEPQPGVYDFGWLHAFAELADSYGIKLRPYIAYTAPWAADGGTDQYYWNDPPKNIEEWYKFLNVLAREMSVHPNIVSYEIYNEVNDSTWWDGTVKQYNYVLQHGAEAIRRGNPRAQVILSGFVFPDYDWLSAICDDYGNGSAFDVAPFHAYPETWEDSTVETYLDAQYYDYYVPELSRHCGGQPIWVNELGFATTEGKTEQQQSYWWARAFGTFLADSKIQDLGIYQIRDVPPGQGVIGSDANYHLGITTVHRKPKLAYFTIGMLVKLLPPGVLTTADNELTVNVTSGQEGEPYFHLFRRQDGHQILFAYDKMGSPTVSIHLATAGTTANFYALDGTKKPYLNFDGTTLSNVQLAPGEISIIEVAP